MALLIDNFKHKSKQNWELLEGCKWGVKVLCDCLGLHKFILFFKIFVLIFSSLECGSNKYIQQNGEGTLHTAALSENVANI